MMDAVGAHAPAAIFVVDSVAEAVCGALCLQRTEQRRVVDMAHGRRGVVVAVDVQAPEPGLVALDRSAESARRFIE